MVDIPPDQIWMVVIGFLIAFILAFGIGANDVANSFGTSVGAKVLTLKQACILASIFETLGAILLGAKVSDTIRKGIVDITPYQNNTELLMVGNVAALSGSCVWLMAATLLRMPVSATHSIVGATVGFALVAMGTKGINWGKLAMIIGSWFVSPVLAGCISIFLFFLCKHFILTKADPLEPGLVFLPVFYGLTVLINSFSVFYDGPEMLYFDRIPLWGTFVISFGAALLIAIFVKLVVVPWQRRRITAKISAIKYKKGRLDGETGPQSAAANGGLLKGNNPPELEYTFIEQGLKKLAPPESKNAEAGDVLERNGTGTTPALEMEQRDDDVEIMNQRNAATSPGATPTDNTNSGHRPSQDAGVTERQHGRNSVCSILVPPNISSGVLTNITHPAEEHKSKHPPGEGDPKAKPKIDKHEDAPLMDNEYKLGTTTPVTGPTPLASKAPTVENINQIGQNGTRGFTPTVQTVGVPAVEKPPKDIDDTVQKTCNNWTPFIVMSVDEEGRSAVKDRPETAQLFSFLQIVTAVFGAFAHGGNDVSNAIGPLVSLWLIGSTGAVTAKAATPVWILFYGGAGISIGLWIWGRRVIKTLGEDLTKITPSSGFCIEIGSALTVLIASNIGIPISTTHCKVGSVVFVGRFRARENVDWSIFRNIVLAWLVTLPVAGGIAAAMMAGLRLTVE